MTLRIFLAALLALACAACSQSTTDTETIEPAATDPVALGAELLGPFKMQLKAALVKGMEAGPTEAISACRLEAPGLAAALSTGGVRMGRSSHKLRNPDNTAPEWLVPILDAYASGEAELAPQLAELAGGRHGYAEPIKVQAMCLTCHGETLHSDVAARVAELYPDDQATGFADGDFRGVFWVEF
jgi:hypothetical protein